MHNTDKTLQTCRIGIKRLINAYKKLQKGNAFLFLVCVIIKLPKDLFKKF